MRYFISALLLLALGAGSVFAQEQKSEATSPAPVAYEVVPNRSWVRFEITQGDSIIRAEFKQYKVEALFHPHNAAAGKIKVVIPLASVSSASQDLVANVVKPEWWDAAVFPEAVFESQEIVALSPGHFVARGALTLKGIQKPVEIHFMYMRLDDRSAMIEGTTIVNRLEFGVGRGEWEKTGVIKSQVMVKFRLEAVF